MFWYLARDRTAIEMLVAIQVMCCAEREASDPREPGARPSGGNEPPGGPVDIGERLMSDLLVHDVLNKAENASGPVREEFAHRIRDLKLSA